MASNLEYLQRKQSENNLQLSDLYIIISELIKNKFPLRNDLLSKYRYNVPFNKTDLIKLVDTFNTNGYYINPNKTTKELLNLIIKLLNIAFVPYFDDVLASIDGTIIKKENNFYFKDISGNNRDFLITGYDFPANWTIGFPYKSNATISAPIGDKILIAADINNYFYTNGIPNEINVVSLFQDVDYEHKVFTRHHEQVLDDNLEEVYEPRVAELVIYKTIKNNTNLNSCQVYFNVPTEITTNVNWITKQGANANAGTKSLPWLSINRATQTGTSNNIVYVKSGDYQEDNVGNLTGKAFVNINTTIICIGRVTIRSYASDAVFFIFNSVNFILKNAIVGNSPGFAGYPIYSTGTTPTITLDKCILKNGAYALNNPLSSNITISNTIFSNISNRLIQCGTTDVTVTGSKSDTNVTAIISGTAASLKTFRLKYNDFISLGIQNSFASIIDISYNTGGSINISNSAAVSNSSSVIINRNKLSSNVGATVIQLGSNYYNTSITYNKLVSRIIGAHFSIAEQTTCLIKGNILYSEPNSNRYATLGVASSTSLLKTLYIEDNSICTASDSYGPPLLVGDESVEAGFNTYSGIIQRNVAIGYGSASLLHGITVFNHSKLPMRYNWSENFIFGFIHKVTALDLADSDISFNISKDCSNGISAKGGLNQKIYNNIIINPKVVGFTQVFNNLFGGSNTLNTQFFNNIIVETGVINSSYNHIGNQTGCTITSNNNVFYSLNNSDQFNNGATTITFAQWQALGRDLNSITTNPNINNLGIPQTPITIGADLGLNFKDGLDIRTSFGDYLNYIPNIIIRTQQINNKEVGAYIQQ